MYGNHLRYAGNIINGYDGSVPLSVYLKEFFRAHKQMGSRDRKVVSGLVYNYFRLGHLNYDSIEERLLAGLNKTLKPGKIFPWTSQLSDNIDADLFSESFLVQPDLFIRTRTASAIAKLEAAGVAYYLCGDHCIGLSNSTKIDQILTINKDAVVQDKSSQRTAGFLKGFNNIKVWDCCAASGGKSIMAYDMIPSIDLTVSDIRPSILHNLRKRFAEAGIDNYRYFVVDLEREGIAEQFDLVIADVPCSGSGTWSRTPEQLYFFKEEKIDYYQQLQRKILKNVFGSIKKGGYLLYITCSVFKKENEDQVAFLSASGLQLIESKLLSGYSEKADTLFAALFTT